MARSATPVRGSRRTEEIERRSLVDAADRGRAAPSTSALPGPAPGRFRCRTQPGQCRRPSPAPVPHDDGGPPAAGLRGQGRGIEQRQVELSAAERARCGDDPYSVCGLRRTERKGFRPTPGARACRRPISSTRTVSPVARRYRATAGPDRDRLSTQRAPAPASGGPGAPTPGDARTRRARSRGRTCRTARSGARVSDRGGLTARCTHRDRSRPEMAVRPAGRGAGPGRRRRSSCPRRCRWAPGTSRARRSPRDLGWRRSPSSRRGRSPTLLRSRRTR